MAPNISLNFLNNVLKSKCLSKKLSRSYADYKSGAIYYDVIVVGGGHAGTEACTAAARMGANTLLITHKKAMIGAMSCNPSFGGIGKGHLMKEIDALDGVCARICDRTGIHYKILNRRKGPAVWGYRAQIDRTLYKEAIQKELSVTPNLSIIESSVEDLILKNRTLNDAEQRICECAGVMLKDGQEVLSDCVVLTTGTFLRGVINIGLDVKPAGRLGDEPAIGLAKTLENMNFQLGRLRTGTPPRLDKNTIDFSACLTHRPDDIPLPFSFMTENVWLKPEDQLNCHMTFTNDKVGKIVKETLHLNRHVREEVEGPRYCPSLESKILRYPGLQHQVWLEPEGLNSSVIYPQGISCTMPAEKQQELVRQMPGLESCEIVQPGYGVEYDFINPQELTPQLETKKVSRLYFAGQINGTTGYEEAAAQGLIAGANAAATSQGRPGLTVDRTEGYIGVLIDDLTTHGTSEPYRMFTSRSEFRFRLRPDNADLRLTRKGYEAGCVSQERQIRALDMKAKLKYWINVMKKKTLNQPEWEEIVPDLVPAKNNRRKSAFQILENVPLSSSVDGLFQTDPSLMPLREDEKLFQRLRIEALYSTAIHREVQLMESIRRNLAMTIPPTIDYNNPRLQLSNEIREKLAKIRPATIAAAHFIPGMTPAAITSLLAYVELKKKDYEESLS